MEPVHEMEKFQAEEFEDNEIHQHVKSEDKKFVFDNSYESLNDFKTEVVDENDSKPPEISL